LKPEIILSLGSDEGSITLYGVNLGDNWSFLLKSDKIHTELVSEPQSYERGFEAALALLDAHNWHLYIPRTIHPLFAEQLLDEVEKRIPPHHLRFNYWSRLVERCVSLKQTKSTVM
jgi:hypothetical protein